MRPRQAIVGTAGSGVRLVLVELLPRAIQRQVREGRIATPGLGPGRRDRAPGGRRAARHPHRELADIEQAERLISAPDAGTLKGKRDRALLAVLIGCGLRRSEVSDLTFDHMQQR